MGALSDEDAREALIAPAKREGIHYDDDAIAEILTRTRGYLHFFQEWSKHAWDIAEGNAIQSRDARQVILVAQAALSASFFLVRFDKMTPSGKRYVEPWPNSAKGRTGPVISEGN